MTADSHDNDDASSFADEVFDLDFVIEDLVEEDQLPVAEEGGEDLTDLAWFGAEADVDESGSGRGSSDATAEAASAARGEDAGLSDAAAFGLTSGAETTPPAPELIEAAETVADELGSLLEEEEDFGLDSEVDLELVTGDEGFEAPAAFVLDDGEGLWEGAGDGAAASTVDACPPAAPDSEELVTPSIESGLFGSVTHQLPPTDAPGAAAWEGDATSDEGDAAASDAAFDPSLHASGAERDGAGHDWAPLVDADHAGPDAAAAAEDDFDTSGYEGDDVYQDTFAEEPGQEVAGVAGGSARDEGILAPYEHAEGCDGGAPADVEGHDIYAEEDDEPEAVVIGGPGSTRRRWGGALATAASLAVVGFGATAVTKPAWFGFEVAPARVERVELARPTVTVAVGEPAKVRAPAASEPRAALAESAEGATGPEQPLAAGRAPGSAGGKGAGAPARPDASAPAASTPVAELADRAPQRAPSRWPAAPAVETVGADRGLTRFGDDLLVGGRASAVGEPAQGSLDVAPGSRAFAQLHNGNYFVGRVKKLAEAAITLRVATGEVTLPRAAVATFTRLGSAEYEELQRVTEGAVRLTNNQRLVGGILSRVADDHVVLEVRSNRVMLPRDSVGQIVNSAAGSDVRLGTTQEEDRWLRSIAARELGTGRGLETPPTTGSVGDPR